MKRIIFFLIGLVCFMHEAYSQDEVQSFNSNYPSTYGSFSLGYDLMFLNEDFPNLNGFNFQVLYGARLGHCPLYLEAGLGLSYNTYKGKSSIPTLNPENMQVIYKSIDDKINSFNAYLPVNFGYMFSLNEKYKIYPFTGVSFRINPTFDYFFDYKDDYITVRQMADAKLFQLSWQIGLKFYISKLYFGVQYGLDLLPKADILTQITPADEQLKDYSINVTNKLKSSNLIINVGIFLH